MGTEWTAVRRIPRTRGLTLGGSDRSMAWYSCAARKVITTTGCIAAITAGRTTTCCRFQVDQTPRGAGR